MLDGEGHFGESRMSRCYVQRSKTKENVIKRKFNIFNVEYKLFWTGKTGFVLIMFRTTINIKHVVSITKLRSNPTTNQKYWLY